MKLDSKSLVLNLLGTDANIQINKKVLLTLGLEEAFFLSYLIDQYKYFEREGLLREDGSFYSSNMDIALYTTLNNSQIVRIKKAGVNKELFKISLEESRTKSYYYLNFDKILEMIGTEKTNFELAYDSKFDSEKININIETFEDIENLRKLTFNELRFLCKQNKIKYTGNDKKEILINKIVEIKNPLLSSNIQFTSVNNISFTSEQKNRSLRKNEDSTNLVNENTLTVSEKSMTNHDIINQEQISCHVRDREIENLFHELDINYTDSNVESANKILKSLNEDKELLKEYIITFYTQTVKNAFNIQNKSAFFSAKLKIPDEILIKKLLSKKSLKLEEEKKKIKKLKEIELLEEKNRKKEEQRVEIDLILKKFNELSIEKQEKILHIAEEKRLKKVPDIATSLYLFKENSKTTYYRMLSSDIKEVFLEENLL